MKLIERFMERVGSSKRRKDASSPSLIGDSCQSSSFFGGRNSKRRSSKENGEYSTEQDSSVVSLNSCSGSVTAPWRAEKIFVTGPPREDDWWGSVSDASVDEGEDGDSAGTEVSLTETPKKFHNCGLEAWEKARAAWRDAGEGIERPQPQQQLTLRSSASRRKELYKGLSRSRSLRSYELPRRTNLKDIIETYVTIWNGMDDL